MFLILRPQTETETANPPPPAELSLANLPLNIYDILPQKAGESQRDNEIRMLSPCLISFLDTANQLSEGQVKYFEQKS